jgi:hypothetical protein
MYVSESLDLNSSFGGEFWIISSPWTFFIWYIFHKFLDLFIFGNGFWNFFVKNYVLFVDIYVELWLQ